MLEIVKVIDNKDVKERERVFCQVVGKVYDNDVSGIWCENGWSRSGENGLIPEIGDLLYIDYIDSDKKIGVYLAKVKHNIVE